MKKIFLILLFITASSCSKNNAEDGSLITSSAYILWNSNFQAFIKKDDTDAAIANNQDRLTNNVWITRDNDGGQIYNVVKESSANKNKSPTGTEWAIGTLNELSLLKFKSFRSTVDKPKEAVGKDLVMHLIDDDIYLNIKFTSWSVGKKGGFSYERSAP